MTMVVSNECHDSHSILDDCKSECIQMEKGNFMLTKSAWFCRSLSHYLFNLDEQLNFILDCQWSDWNVGTCSDSCGGGLLTKTRSKTVEEANGGVCNNQFSVTEDCNSDICPGT